MSRNYRSGWRSAPYPKQVRDRLNTVEVSGRSIGGKLTVRFEGAAAQLAAEMIIAGCSTEEIVEACEANYGRPVLRQS